MATTAQRPTSDRPTNEQPDAVTTDGAATEDPDAASRTATTAPPAEPAPAVEPGADGRRAPGALWMPRSRGALTGLAVFALGVWGAIVPFIGPYFHYAYINRTAFSFPTYGRLWLDILPGALAALAGLELMRSANRPTAITAAMTAAIAGAWFVVGPTLSMLWNHGKIQSGRPLGGTVLRAIEQLGYFYALGAAILFLGALALGRVATRSVRDARVAERRATGATEPSATA
jgi:hypothetical protein